VTLFALVCGYLPFEDGNTSLLYKKILAGDYKPPKWISNEGIYSFIHVTIQTYLLTY
jgi:5'-AMP-activated protein kinase catalytic alpha subunit